MQTGDSESLIDTRVGVVVLLVTVAGMLYSIPRSGGTAILVRALSFGLFGVLAALMFWRLYQRAVRQQDGDRDGGSAVENADWGVTEPTQDDVESRAENGEEETTLSRSILGLSFGEYRMLFACLGIATFPLIVPYDGSLTVPGLGSVVVPWYIISAGGLVGFYLSYRLIR